MKFQFPVSNNEAAKEALCASSHMAKSLQLTHILVRSDSQVIVGQVIGEFEAKEDNMQKYLECVQQLSSEFSQILFGKESWEENMCADMLSKLSVREPTEGTWKNLCKRRVFLSKCVLLKSQRLDSAPLSISFLEKKF